MQALVFANGELSDGPMVRRALDFAINPMIVAADGGARNAMHLGLRIDMLIGDMDSLPAAEVTRLEKQNATIHRYPIEKDETDLELTLKRVVGAGATWIRIIGGLGGRLDQTLANLYLLALPELTDCDVRLVAGNQEAWLLRPGKHHIYGTSGDTVSLLPLTEKVAGIRTGNLHYPLQDETLTFGPARGISNVMQDISAWVELQKGLLLLVHSVGQT